jgi:hypothetical protein
MTRASSMVLAASALIGLAILGFFEFPGHTWLQQDTQIYIPMFERIWDPTALQHDIVAAKPHLSFTLYDEITIVLRWVSRTSFQAVLQFQQIVFRVLELLGVYLLAQSFGLTRRMALLVAACFGLGATIVGPSVLTFEYEPVPRGFALGFLFLAIGLSATRWHILAGCSAAIAFLYHPPTAIPVCMVLIFIAIRRRDFLPLIPLACAALLLFIASRFQIGATELQSFFVRIDPEWENLERFRASYNWISVWFDPLIWQYLFFWALTILAVWRIRPRSGRAFAIGLPLIGIVSVPVSYILTERVKWSIMPQVQPARALLWVTAFAMILGATAAVRAAERRIWWEAILWFAVVFAIPLEPKIADISTDHVMLAVALAAFATSAVLTNKYRFLAAAIVIPYFAIPFLGHVQNYPRLHTPEIAALVSYATTNTPKDAMFLFPDAGKELYPGLFRAEAIRPVYVDWKAGGQVNYFRSLAEDWWSRWQSTMSGKDIAGNPDRFRGLGIDYVVMKRIHPLAGLTPEYGNGAYLLYRLAKNSSTSARAGTDVWAPGRVTEIAAAAFANRSASPIPCCSPNATARAALKTSPAAVVSRAVTSKPGL